MDYRGHMLVMLEYIRGLLVPDWLHQAPKIDKIENQVFEFDDKCYKFNKKATKCDNTKKVVEFA